MFIKGYVFVIYRRITINALLYLCLTTISSCAVLDCKPIGKIQFNDFYREQMARYCYNNPNLLSYSVCIGHSQIGNKLKSEAIVKEVIKKLQLTSSNQNVLSYQEFLDRLDIRYIYRKKEIITISYQSSDDKLAVQIINMLMKTYIQESNRKVDVPFVIKQKHNIEKELEQYKKRQKLPNLADGKIEEELFTTASYDINSELQKLERMNSVISLAELDSSLKNRNVKIIQFAEESCFSF